MKNKLLLYSTILLLSFTAYSQEEHTLLGEVKNNVDVEGVHVLNISSRVNAITDHQGNFSIEAQPQDTLVFSAVNFYPKKVLVTQENYDTKKIEVTLRYLLNELDEVVIGNQLSGDLAKDLRNIKTEKNFNFDDVGIPGFKGEPKEKIPAVLGEVITPVSVDVEALYKHLSGYYKNLKLMRKWQGQSDAAAQILHLYSPSFFEEAYGIPKNKTYNFVLMCIETSEMREDVRIGNYNGILTVFKQNAPLYLSSLNEKE